MDSVDVVAAHDVQDDFHGVVAGSGGAGVHQQHGAVALHQVRPRQGNVVAAHGVVHVRLGAEGVEPCVQFNAAAVGLLNGEGQGIVARVDAGAGKPLTPGLQRGTVQGVRIRSHLEEHGIQFQLGAGVQDI